MTRANNSLTSYTPIQGPSGSTAYLIKCRGAAIEACYEEAARVCPKGYALADKQASNAVAVPKAGGGFIMARSPHNMLIECKPG